MDIVDRIKINYIKQLQKVEGLTFKRYLYPKLMGLKDIVIGIRGLRGVGKTTLLLQMSKEKENSIYLSADSYYLRAFDLYDVLLKLIRAGYKNLFIDEIHRIEDWPFIIKTIYDEENVNIYFSGSSSIGLSNKGADLSRRAAIFELKPASLREWLSIKKGLNLPILTLKDIINKNYSPQVLSASEYLEEYYSKGGLLHSNTDLAITFENIIKKMVVEDLPSVREVNTHIENVIFRLIYLVASSQPGEISYNSLASHLGVSKKLITDLIEDLSQMGIFNKILPCARGSTVFRKTPKIYMPIPFRYSLNSLIGKEFNRGLMREEFFVNHNEGLCYPKEKRKSTDFMLGDILFEIGGKSKTNEQGANYRVLETVEHRDNIIPLYLFGFLY